MNQQASLMARRGVLRGLAALLGAASFACSFGLRVREGEAGLEDWLRRFGDDLLGDLAALGRFGAIYLSEHPNEGDRGSLSRQLAGDGSTPVRLGLVEGIARDWREHDVVVVEGWVYARTEARICALLHLMSRA
jgi:hypothetical protein